MINKIRFNPIQNSISRIVQKFYVKNSLKIIKEDFYEKSINYENLNSNNSRI